VKLNLRQLIVFQFQALSSRRYQNGLHRVHLHHPTLVFRPGIESNHSQSPFWLFWMGVPLAFAAATTASDLSRALQYWRTLRFTAELDSGT